jgi:uncharacterized membrane protein (UPF0127 family)
MEVFDLKINDKTFKCSVAQKASDRKVGYSGVGNVPKEDECMLFVFPSPGKYQMWMKDATAALDIVFFDDSLKILDIIEGSPDNEELLGTHDNVSYVLEFLKGTCKDLNINTGDTIKGIPDNHLEPDPEENYSMFVLDEEGQVQMEIKGGERIFSRKSTKRIVNGALNAESDKDYKKLARTTLKEILAQDGRGPDPVKGKTKEIYELEN